MKKAFNGKGMWANVRFTPKSGQTIAGQNPLLSIVARKRTKFAAQRRAF
jgi:hypothetical protein